MTSLEIQMLVFSHIQQLDTKHSFPLHIYLEAAVISNITGHSFFFLQEAEKERETERERSAADPQSLLTGCALFGGLFPAFTGNAHIGNRFSLTVDLSQKPVESTLSCLSLHTKMRQGLREGANLKLISLILQGVGYFLQYFFFF